MIFFMIVGEVPEKEQYRQPKIDEELIVRIGRDDRSALEELYTLTERSVYGFVLAIVKNPCDTQDIVQETYLKIRASAHLYQKKGKPMAWILTIARNLSMDLFRQNAHYENGEKVLEDSLEYSYISDPLDRLVLESAMKLLNERERQILLLHLVGGVRHREIAADLNLPLSTVLSCFNRSLKKLRRYLEEMEAAQ